MNTFKYQPPNFGDSHFRDAPMASFEPAPDDGVLPAGFFPTTNLPTYVRTEAGWIRPARPRMDCVIVRQGDGNLYVIEPRRVTKGDQIALGETEDGSGGIFVHAEGFLAGRPSANEFQFMGTAVSRERPVNYEHLARELCLERRRNGHIVWVAGPALVHSRARNDFTWFISHGYVSVVLAGNALAVHDLEAAIYGTTLGMTASGEATTGGHALHMRTINTIRAHGSIASAVETGVIDNGIMHALVTHNIPYVLAGSIRDDGPLPEVLSDASVAQDAMREHAVRATFAVFVATALHAIAVGNMLPAFVESGEDQLRPLATICVDQTEFVVNKLRDRGTHQAYGVVTNAQDFMHVLRFYVERWEQANAC